MSKSLIVLVSLLFRAVAMAADGEIEKKKEGEKTGATQVAKTYPAQDPAKGGVEGRILFEGERPVPKPIEIPASQKDRGFCEKHLKDERLLISEKNELKDVVVSVAGYKPAARVEPREITLDNKNCAFVPHVQATTAGSKLKITNSDPFLHNTQAVLAASFNPAVAPGSSSEQNLRKPGWAVISCSFHPWMQAHIWIFAHDLFDVSAADGSYRIPNIPPGEYEIDFWHEYPLKAQKQKVTIEAGKTARLDVRFRKPEK